MESLLTISDWTTTTAIALGCIVFLHIGRRALGQSSCPLPPGPPGLPWAGNIIGIDTDAPWKTYADWAKTYGDIVYSRLLGKDIIIINSEKIAKELLEHRSKNYSDRPKVIVTELIGFFFNTGLLAYGDIWRLHRRFFHQTFRLEVVRRFIPILHGKSCDFLRKLLVSPDELEDLIFEYTTSVILNSTYDYNPSSQRDELLSIIENMLKIVMPKLRPGITIIVDTFPFLLHLPSWFPGMSFKETIKTAHAYSRQYLERPFEYSLHKIGGSVAPSMVHDALQSMEKKGISPDESWMETLKGASGTAFLAASETSDSVLATFFLMMMLNPAVQQKAQAQIDIVVGRERLPTMDDRPLLPLLDAIFWEILRYSPIVPLSVPHAVLDNDVYNGYHIPKGALVLTNLWSIAHDESRYTDPYVFTPERFLNGDGSLKENEIRHIAFGFGRRICPGRHFADSSVWNLIAKVLAVFKISKPLDDNGTEIPVEEKFTSTGLVVHPLPFKCRIVPRFLGMDAEKLEELIAASSAS